jgi:hypothetical protein
MRTLIWLLIVLGILSFMMGGLTAFMQVIFRIPPHGFWRGATGFWILAIVLRMMEDKRA